MKPVVERLYTVPEVSALLRTSSDQVRKLFRNRPGVMRLGMRRHSRMRIPESLLEKVMAEMGYVRSEDGTATNHKDAGRNTARA